MNSPLIISFFLFLWIAVESAGAIGEDDRITSLPGVTFETNVSQYSGYLNANPEGTWKYFYWLAESAKDPNNDPLLIWFNGGPGCSSLGGLLAEYGPFFVNKGGQSLYQNVYAWNTQMNVLFLENPLGVGFSHDVHDHAAFSVGDDETAEQNLNAIVDFFTRVQPKFLNRTWFLAGESYAGIYITTLTNLVLKAIGRREFPNSNFQGIAIGNGYLNAQNLTNSLLHWQWEEIKRECCNDTRRIEDCDFASHIAENSTDTWVVDDSDCGRSFVDLLNPPENQNAYNYYLDCYKVDEKAAAASVLSRITLKNLQTASLLNQDSTDNQNGFNCWNEQAMADYLNREDVQRALHVSPEWTANKETEWELCNDDLNDEYKPKYKDTSDQFHSIFRLVHHLDGMLPANFRLLVFNGDSDTVCNFLGAAWHMERVAERAALTAGERTAWRFRDQLAGFVQPYARRISTGNTLRLDVLVIKGAGHFASDRPGAALQMITNFVRGSHNFSDARDIDVAPIPAPFRLPSASVGRFAHLPSLSLLLLVVLIV